MNGNLCTCLQGAPRWRRFRGKRCRLSDGLTVRLRSLETCVGPGGFHRRRTIRPRFVAAGGRVRLMNARNSDFRERGRRARCHASALSLSRARTPIPYLIKNVAARARSLLLRSCGPVLRRAVDARSKCYRRRGARSEVRSEERRP